MELLQPQNKIVSLVEKQRHEVNIGAGGVLGAALGAAIGAGVGALRGDINRWTAWGGAVGAGVGLLLGAGATMQIKK